jgi:hypothetical protein
MDHPLMGPPQGKGNRRKNKEISKHVSFEEQKPPSPVNLNSGKKKKGVKLGSKRTESPEDMDDLDEDSDDLSSMSDEEINEEDGTLATEGGEKQSKLILFHF